MKAFIPSILYLISAAMFIGTVITGEIMYMLGGAVFMFAASVVSKMNKK